MRGLVQRHPVATFFVLAYALSWSVWIPMVVAGERVGFGSAASHFPGLLGPGLAAAIVTALRDGRDGLRDLGARMVRWRVAPRWYAVALSPLAFFAVAAAVTGWPDLEDLGVFGGVPALGPLGVWLVLTLVNGYGEETGWRGFALPELARGRSPLPATVILAGLWASWHAPTFFLLDTYRAMGPALLPGFVIGLFCGAMFLTWLYGRTRSVLVVALWHGTYNWVTGSRAARGTVAAIVSSLVMAWGIALAVRELRASGRARREARRSAA